MIKFNPLPYINKIVTFKSKKEEKRRKKEFQDFIFITNLTTEVNHKLYTELKIVEVWAHKPDFSFKEYLGNYNIEELKFK